MMTIIANTNHEIIAYNENKDIAINMALDIIKKNIKKENIIHVTANNIFVIETSGLFAAEIGKLYQIIDIDHYIKGNYVIVSNASESSFIADNIDQAYQIIREYIKNKYNLIKKNNYSYNGRILTPDNGTIEGSCYFSVDNENDLTIDDEIFILS